MGAVPGSGAPQRWCSGNGDAYVCKCRRGRGRRQPCRPPQGGGSSPLPEPPRAASHLAVAVEGCAVEQRLAGQHDVRAGDAGAQLVNLQPVLDHGQRAVKPAGATVLGDVLVPVGRQPGMAVDVAPVKALGQLLVCCGGGREGRRSAHWLGA